jgi:hypothetical protein
MNKNRLNPPPSGESWIWLTAVMLKSDAWRSAGLNCRRFVDFLMLELMAHGGRRNGWLKAPEQQLVSIGIGKAYVAPAITEADALGLVDCLRGGKRVATMYRLTWLPHDDGSPATDRWRKFRNPKLKPWPCKPTEDVPQ